MKQLKSNLMAVTAIAVAAIVALHMPTHRWSIPHLTQKHSN